MGRKHIMSPRWLAATLLGAVATASGQLTSRPPPPPPPAAFGTTAANTSDTVELSQLTVAAVESGSSGQPQPVRQAFLASVNQTTSAAGGQQTVIPQPPRSAYLRCCHLQLADRGDSMVP